MRQNGVGLFTVIIVAAWSCLCAISESRAEQVSSWPEIELTAADRILIFAPHPDDEVLGCAGIIQKAVARKIPCRVVFFTLGDSNEWSFLLYRKHLVVMPKAVRAMGEVRHNEAIAADSSLGLTPQNLIFLGYPDFRTLSIWNTHWGKSPAARGLFTDVRAVPYANAFRPGAPYKGEEILKDIKAVLLDFKPTKLFISHPADHNPDHRALYLFTHIALWDLSGEISPQLYPYLIHYARWPQPAGYHPKEQISPPPLFKDLLWQANELTPEQVERKYQAIQKHHSQFIARPQLLLSFIRTNELFSDLSVIRLIPQEFGTASTEMEKQNALEDMTQEALTDEERASFIGIEKRFVQREGDELVFTIELSRPLDEATEFSLYVFGYRNDQPFASMPKLHIMLGALEHKVYDQFRRLPNKSIRVRRHAKEITVRIPLALLDNPQRVLSSANTYLLMGPALDWTIWQIFELEGAAQGGSAPGL